MYFEEPIRRWQIAKYKQIKRDGRAEEPVTLVLDQNRKRLGVYFYEEELEQVYYNMEVSKYPVLRFSDNYLYILFNGQGQGFRLTFQPAQKTEFKGIMQRLAYVSESPAKRRLFDGSARLDTAWPPRNWSASQPTSSSMPPPKRAAARNLAAEFSFTAPLNRPSSSSSFSSRSSPFSSSSSTKSFSRPESRSSTASRASRASECLSQDPFLAPKPSTPPPKETMNKCIQTVGNFENLMEELAQDTNFSMACLKKLMEQQKFGDLVKTMREEIRKMPEKDKEEFEKITCPKTSPIPVAEVVLKSETQGKPKKSPFLTRRETSEMEYDVFEDSNDK